MEQLLNAVEHGINWFVAHVDGPLWDVLVLVLIGTGLYFTITTAFVQVRLFPQSLREMISGRKGSDKSDSLTPFQAFATGLASRVGVGNIGGVATAIALGGEGAVFWMWVMALIGMGSAFAESSLAQLFKTRNPDGTFIGGPAYYISTGLRAPWLAALFAVALIFTFGFAFNSVQANSIVEATRNAWGWDAHYVGIVLVVITAPILFGGVKLIGKVASVIVPLMALFYLIMAAIIFGMNIEMVPSVFSRIISSAFNFEAAAGGMLGALFSKAMLMGIKRGLFSNEAGMGSAPNSAASSDAKHPVSQGLVQMLGVFVDTIIVCTCTAVIILLSDNYGSETFKGIALTQNALAFHVGEFGTHFLALILILFCYTSIIGNYAYAESNARYLKNKPWAVTGFRLIVLFFVYFGSVHQANTVWNFSDTVMGIMAMINLIAILLLSPMVWLLLKDYQAQIKSGKKEPEFSTANYQHLIRRGVDKAIWK